MPPKRKLNSLNSSNAVIPPKISRGVHHDVEDISVRINFKEPGIVLSHGQGDVGQLGLGEDVLERSRPTLVPNVSKIVNVCAGGMHTLCLTEDGEILSFGCNDEGALGREGDEFEPKQIILPNKVVQVSAGDSHSAALLEDGTVHAWGAFRDSHGSMGLTDNAPQKLPVLVDINEKVIKIASGADHLVMLTSIGHVYTCGCGEQGQLGRLSERSASRLSRQGLGQLLVPSLMYFATKWKIFADDIWAGLYCTFIKNKHNNHIYVCGLNNYNQLGVIEESVGEAKLNSHFFPVKSESFSNREWTKISGGQHHTLCLDNKGVAYSLGRKDYGRLGLGDDCSDKSEPTPIPALQGKRCVDIACGSCVSFAVTHEGELFSWGMGTNGQLGTGDEEDVYVPKKVLGKELKERRVLEASGGGQHTVLLAV